MSGLPDLPPPFSCERGGLVLAGCPLADIVDVVEQENVAAAWVVDHEACAEDFSALEVLTLALVPQDELLALAASAGTAAARVFSREDLERALRVGFDAARVLVDGRVKDDGLLLAALSVGVVRIVCYDDEERGNLERIARTMALSVPPDLRGGAAGLPPEAGSTSSQAEVIVSGGLLTRVLRGTPSVQLDAPLASTGPFTLLPLAPGEPDAARVRGLSGVGIEEVSCAATAFGTLARGDWVVVPTRAAAVRGPSDPSHSPSGTALVRAGRVRWLDASVAPKRN